MRHTTREHRLASGAKGLIVHVPGSPVINLMVRFNSGYRFGEFAKYEVPHLMEHLIGCGSKRYPDPNQFKVEITKNGAYRNANTSARFNGYIIECAAFELPRILDLLEEYLTAPLFPDEALPTEVSNVSEELRRNITDHERACGIALAEQVAPQDYLNFEARLSQLGTMTRGDVVGHYQRTHTARNARFYVAGAITPKIEAVLLARLEEIFARLPTGERLEYSDTPGLLVPEPIVTQRDISLIFYEFQLFSGELDDQTRRALRLMRVILFGGFASRVYGTARQRGLAYHIGGTSSAGPGSSSFGFSGNVSWDHALPLFELAVTEIERLRETAPSASELGAAVDFAIGTTERSYQTAGDLLGYYAGMYDLEGRFVDFDDETAALRTVTPDEIKAVAAHIAGKGTAWALSLLGALDAQRADALAGIVKRLT